MPKEIRLVALDLDGTLLNREKTISPRNRTALEELHRRGVWMVPITGRPAQGLPQAVLDLPGLRYAVTSNGATIRDLVTGETLLESHLDAETALRVLDACKDFDMIRELFRDGIGYLSQADYEILRDRYTEPAMRRYVLDTRKVLPGTVEEQLRQDGGSIEELFFLTDSVETKQRLHKALADLPGIAFADPFPRDLEVITGGIDKGEALKFLLQRLDIAPEECIAMGDGGSDVPMLQAAGIGVAMANAEEPVKAAADRVTASCDEDGVALVLEELVLGQASEITAAPDPFYSESNLRERKDRFDAIQNGTAIQEEHDLIEI